jgi:hypothetical protein
MYDGSGAHQMSYMRGEGPTGMVLQTRGTTTFIITYKVNEGGMMMKI